MTVVACPECRAGKHINCTGEVLTDDDKWTGCPCVHSDHMKPREFEAVTPYAGSSGHSGSETSKARADKEDGDGTTATRQYRIGALVFDRGYQGLTWKEARVVFPQWHHGQISSALSTLHKVGQLSRLTASREGCAVYVDPRFERGRETREQGARMARSRNAIDVAHIERQREFSLRTFGPGPRTKGVLDHIRRELDEVEASPLDLGEWVDVIILGIDGAYRAGHEPHEIIAAIKAKQEKNENRTWPDWRTADPDRAIEHDRSNDE